MSSPDNQDNSFSRSASAWMTIAVWIIFFFMLFFLFSKLMNKMNNPNDAVATSYVDGRKEVVLQRNQYGHYVATGAINGEPVVFLVDTGATDIAIPENIADKLGLIKGHAFQATTANGLTTAYSTRLDEVALGDITLRDVRGSILSNAGTDEILLGMVFLKHLEMNQKGDQLTLTQ